MLPFYPAGWPLGLTIATAAIGLAWPRAALAVAFAVTFFPLCEHLARARARLRRARGRVDRDRRGPTRAATSRCSPGRCSGPLAALALLPLAAQFARGPARRAVQAAAGTLLAVLIAGLRHDKLPFDGSIPPRGLGIGGSIRPRRGRLRAPPAHARGPPA